MSEQRFVKIGSMENNSQSVNHSVVMENRNRMVISGVKEVEGFTETEVSLYTSMGQLTIKGKNLHVTKFSTETGELILSGDLISALVYSNRTDKLPENFITKLFR